MWFIKFHGAQFSRFQLYLRKQRKFSSAKLKRYTVSLMADFSTNWSASDQPIFPYNLETEAQIEVPQAPEDRAK